MAAAARPATPAAAIRECNPMHYPNIRVMLQLACTLPVTSCECERSASSMRRLHTYMRTSMTQERLLCSFVVLVISSFISGRAGEVGSLDLRSSRALIFSNISVGTGSVLIRCRPEEIYLTRRQRATLSQLRSGHCKLLNSYKKRLKQTDSSSCPDCGMDPQDVPHLFNCTAHPTTLTPESLWDRPVKTIRELSFLDPENLD